MPDHPQTNSNLWILYALLGALFAGVVQVMSKPAGDKIGANPVSLIRTVVMLVFFMIVVAWPLLASTKYGGTTRPAGETASLAMAGGWKSPLIFALGAGLASSLSWLFGYKALKLSAVAPSYSLDKLSLVFGIALAVIFLGERPTGWNWLGVVTMIGGAYLATMKSA